ncbi:MAG: phage tail tape measure protein [Parcubacteria group bacterium]|jgi:TP901 family phage tail tape measure protein|nr:phage tail tape measure protein [Parcubacteria group bacterium]|tara:strand:- start:7322 stop:10309 length:2988 start_codon:yes stop_codon:yes gene_type:complete
MANYSITAVIGAVTDKFNKGLDAAKNKAKSFAEGTTNAVKGVGTGIQGATNKLAGFGNSFQQAMGHPAVQAATAAGRAMVEFGTDAVKTAGRIEASMNEVFTLLPGITKGAKDQMSQELLELSAEMGKMPEDFIGSLYNALSAGVPQENVFDFLKTASKSAIAGVSSTEEAVGALTTVINGYKLPVTEAANVSDTLFTIIKNGVTTMPELAANIGKVTPIAASLGVSFDEVGAAFAEMTKNLGPGKSAETGTMLKAFFNEISKAGTKSADTFERISGKSFPEFIKGGGSVAEALNMMSGEADKTGTRLTDMFGSIEAGQAALILGADNARGLGEQMEEMGKKAGATETAFQTVDQGFSRMMEKLMAGFEVFKVTVGQALEPLVNALMPQLMKGLKMLGALPWNKVGELLGALMEAYAPIQDVLFELIEELFPLLINMLKMVLPQIVMMLPALQLLLKAIVLLLKPLNWIMEILGKYGEVIAKIIGWIGRLIQAATQGPEAFKKELEAVLGDMKEFKEALLEWIGPFKKIYDWVVKLFSESKEGLSSTMDAVAHAAKMLWTLIKLPFQLIWDAAQALFDGLKSLADKFIERWKTRASTVMSLVDNLISFVRNKITAIRDFLLKVRQSIMDKLYEIFPWLEDMIDSLSSFVQNKIQGVWDFIKGIFTSIKDYVLSVIEGIWESVESYVSMIYNFVKTKIEEMVAQFMSSNNEVVEALRYFLVFGQEVFGVVSSLVEGAIGLFGKLGDAISWATDLFGGAESAASELNSEVEQTSSHQEKTTAAVQETVAVLEQQVEKEAAIAGQKRDQVKNAEAQFKAQQEIASQTETIKGNEEQITAAKQAQSLAQQEYVQHGAEMIKTSNIHIGQLNAAIEKHSEINSLGEAYKFIAEGEKTPEQIINEAFGAQVALNAEGQKYSIRDSNGMTPAQQINAAIPEQAGLNAEALNNPLLKLKKGELKITCEQGDNKELKIMIQQLGLIHRDITSLHKTVSNKFCNQ